MAFSAIIKPSDYFTPELYVGTGSSRTISTLNFQPDWVWIKNRDTTDRHSLFDVVRAAPNMLSTNNNDAQSAQASELTAFNTNGFTVNTATSVNGSSANYVSWNWKAGGGQGSSNTDGSINTTYTSANTTSGFSISTYTGTGSNATVGHGLGVAPKMFIVKRLNSTGAFRTYHQATGNLGQFALNATDEVSDVASMWNSTSPTNSTISIGTHAGVNASGGTYVAYCFADVKGFSKMGSYIGNGNADGTFAYTGFKPAFVIIKRKLTAQNWAMFDNKRQGYNVANNLLYPNNTTADTTGTFLDLLSNGFKMRTTASWSNASGASYIYMAFAETPFVANSGQSIPTTAR